MQQCSRGAEAGLLNATCHFENRC